MARYRVTVDTGGTFSDFVYPDEDAGTVSIAKVASTPDDPSRAILQGIEMLLAQGVAAEDVRYFCHGTTVGTNAILEGKGVKTALLVTQGFAGIYPVAEQARPYGAAIFDVMFDKPAPLVPPSLTREVKERVDFRGTVLRELDEAALRETLRELAGEGIESFAVCQRVNIARALVMSPELLLLDEPFAALDAQTREFMQVELLKILARARTTALFITHQINEAVFLSNRVVVFSARPARIKEIVDIDLPPARSLDLKQDVHFLSLERRIWRLIEEEAARTGMRAA